MLKTKKTGLFLAITNFTKGTGKNKTKNLVSELRYNLCYKKKSIRSFLSKKKSTQKLAVTKTFHLLQIWLLDLSLHFRLCHKKHSQTSTK